MKTYKTNNIVTFSNDRSKSVDGTIVLSARRKDLESKWEEFDGEDHEVWEGWTEDGERHLFERNLHNASDSEFALSPDFDNDLSPRAIRS